jgi:ribosomal protein S18 acetylase RimI-like enzyme
MHRFVAYWQTMGWWRSSRDGVITARQASASDRPIIAELLADAWWRHGAAALEDQIAMLHGGVSAVAFVRGRCVGWLGLSVREPTGDTPERWADVASVAISGGRSPAKALQALFDTTSGDLGTRGVTGLVCLTSESWLRESLSYLRFLELDRVVGYARAGRLSSPPAIAGPARLRPARVSEGELVLALNSAAFAPIWRYDSSTVLSWLLTADHAVLADTEAGPAGFGLTTSSRDSDYAQLVRVAIAPQFQGCGIGRQVVLDAIEYAREIGAGGLCLNTQASNMISRRLYEGLGFRLTDQSVSVLVRGTSTTGSV